MRNRPGLSVAVLLLVLGLGCVLGAAIWYTPRSSSRAADGVLYPDVGKIRTLAAYY